MEKTTFKANFNTTQSNYIEAKHSFVDKSESFSFYIKQHIFALVH